MTDFEDLERQNVGTEDESDDLKISDLPPETGSHQLLLRLAQMRERLYDCVQAFSRHAIHAQHADSATHTETPALTRTQQHTRIGRTLTALGLCVALLLLLVGNVPALRAQFIGLFEPATPTPTSVVYESSFARGNVPIEIDHPNNPAMEATATAMAGITGLAPLPASCPRVSMLQSFLTRLDPPGLGGDPIWLMGFTGPVAALAFLQPISQLSDTVSHPIDPFAGTTSGWYQSLSVFISQDYRGTISLHGASQSGKSEVEFSYVNASDTATPNSVTSLDFAPALTLSLQHPGTIHFNANGDWEMTDINILVPQAGCYELQASWHNSTWTQYFAAGNVA